jgi:predicted dehydrogenase
MLEKEGKNIDIVTISTPDHTHAAAAMACMELGKHVYVQKPLSHDVFEARKLTEAARKYKVATQMGNQGHSSEDIRLIKEWIADGAIGHVRRVHCWTNRPVWPQGMMSRPWRRLRFRIPFRGICGLGQRLTGLTIRTICQALGEAGGISVQG